MEEVAKQNLPKAKSYVDYLESMLELMLFSDESGEELAGGFVKRYIKKNPGYIERIEIKFVSEPNEGKKEND